MFICSGDDDTCKQIKWMFSPNCRVTQRAWSRRMPINPNSSRRYRARILRGGNLWDANAAVAASINRFIALAINGNIRCSRCFIVYFSLFSFTRFSCREFLFSSKLSTAHAEKSNKKRQKYQTNKESFKIHLYYDVFNYFQTRIMYCCVLKCHLHNISTNEATEQQQHQRGNREKNP